MKVLDILELFRHVLNEIHKRKWWLKYIIVRWYVILSASKKKKDMWYCHLSLSRCNFSSLSRLNLTKKQDMKVLDILKLFRHVLSERNWNSYKKVMIKIHHCALICDHFIYFHHVFNFFQCQLIRYWRGFQWNFMYCAVKVQ